MNIKAKEIVFLERVVEIINDHNYDIFFDYFVAFYRQEMNVYNWIYVIKELYHRLLVGKTMQKGFFRSNSKSFFVSRIFKTYGTTKSDSYGLCRFGYHL
jgi:hypothetical protein